MHTLLTDRLACPRCGSGFGLILFADRVEDRRVWEGSLGCPNCRDRYPVQRGFADLRPAPRTEDRVGAPPARVEDPDDPEAVRLAALLGVVEGPGHLLLAGAPASFAPALARMIDKIEVVAAESSLAGWEEESGVSRVAVGGRIPLFSGSLRAVALGSGVAEHLLDEAMRTVAPSGRVVVLDPPGGTAARLEGEGFSVVLREEEAVVGVRQGPAGGGPPPGTTPPGTGPLADGRLPVVP